MTTDAAPCIAYPAISQIPVDLLVLKKRSPARDDLTLTDLYGNPVFRVDSRSTESTPRCRVLLDARGDPLITVHYNDGVWQGYRGADGECKNFLLFRVERTFYSPKLTELLVFLVGENRVDSKPDFKVKGCPFKRSCTIYKGNSIVAETSLLYKLRKIIVGRRKFRLTIFPGTIHHDLIIALLVIFFDGRK
ncbi:PREDICTED: protein LURP-one-related 7 [Nelumbo nucifera]|uniref:Protein LURP-one-related 7 n=2 Tax=Nelumbo nucifera TaxID=4432 RepID=A0A1U8A6F7_NELNU|nr:PREDICTED: protein LURP-one-related 7 [Nelumbo nucifera]DAD26384.1 TPA_asm: hypothetical protein HUJ06_027852 [Nelumbo nucifera]